MDTPACAERASEVHLPGVLCGHCVRMSPRLATKCRSQADTVGCIRYILGQFWWTSPRFGGRQKGCLPRRKKARLPRRVFPCALRKCESDSQPRRASPSIYPGHLMNTPACARRGHQKIASQEKTASEWWMSPRVRPNGGRRAAIRGAIPLKARASGGHPRNIGEHQMDTSREKKPDLPMLGVFLRFGQNGQNFRQQRRASRAKGLGI